MSPDPDRRLVASYRERTIDEIVRALGLSPSGTARRLIGPLFRPAAARFARLLARADGEAASSGLPGAARSALSDLALEPVVRGADRVPADGPLVIASNHPGAYDSLAIMAAVPRTDLKVMISDAGLTRAFPAASGFFIFTPFTAGGGARALREAIRHLESGGSLLIFPHVEVEPDPEVRPGAREALAGWSPSLAVLLRRVPGVRLELAMASGILLPRFLRSPLVRIRRREHQRQKLAEVLQLVWQILFPKRVRPVIHLSFAAPLAAGDLPAGRAMPILIEAAGRLLDEHMAAVRKATAAAVP
jgi:hypothetical protein